MPTGSRRSNEGEEEAVATSPDVPSVAENQLYAAIQFADAIRRRDPKPSSTTTTTSTGSATAESSSLSTDPLQPLRVFLDTPGVQQAVMTSVACIFVFVPLRQQFIRTANQYFKLGTVFPDLIITPTLTVITAQCCLWMGSVYGSATYLQHFINVTTKTNTPEASAVVDSICNDPIVNMATKFSPRDETSDMSNVSNNVHSADWASSWDPRQQTLLAYERAINVCRDRHGTTREK